VSFTTHESPSRTAFDEFEDIDESSDHSCDFNSKSSFKRFPQNFPLSLIYSRMKSNDLGGDEYQENETHDAFDLLLNEEPADESLDLSNSFLENGGNSRWEHHNHNEMTASSPPSSSSFVC
jgi:hypothetical protein